jgi:hypothetical protein
LCNGQRTRGDAVAVAGAGMVMSLDDVLFGVIIGGIGLCAAYFREAYIRWREHHKSWRDVGLTVTDTDRSDDAATGNSKSIERRQ